MASQIELTNVCKTYLAESGDEVAALKGINLCIRPHEFVTVVGPSGCGKSSLLRIIAALDQPSTGTVFYDGVEHLKPSRDVGCVFQHPVLLPWRTVLENVIFPAEVSGVPRRQSVAEAKRLLSLVKLDRFAHAKPYELSGGMQQRVAICRSLVHDPSLLLMDEPFGALDALTREDMMFELLELRSVAQKTVVFVTHSITEAILLADRVVVLTARPGRIANVLLVKLPWPRSIEMQFDPVFKECSDTIRELISSRQPSLPISEAA